MSESAASQRRLQAAMRREQAVKLRLAGADYRAIAKQLDMSVSSVYGAVRKALADIIDRTSEDAAQVRAMELARLDALQASQWADAMKGDEQKVDRVLKIMARRAALLGLDAPTKQQVEQRIETVEAYDYGNALAPLAPGPVSNSGASSAGQGADDGPALGEDAHGG